MNKKEMSNCLKSMKWLSGVCILSIFLFMIFVKSSPAADEVVLRYANPTSSQNVQAFLYTLKPYSEVVAQRTEGKVKIMPYHDGALLGLKDMLRGVGSGIAEMGWMHPTDDPSLLPINNLCYVPLFDGPDAYHHTLIGRIITEEFPEFYEEMQKNNFIDLFYIASAPHQIILNKPANSLSELKGRRVRVAGSYFPKLLLPIGMVPQEVSLNEVYESLQRGVIDGAISVLSYFRDAMWSKVAQYLVMPSITPTMPTQSCGMNLNAWRKLSPSIKKVMLEEAKISEKNFGRFMDQDSLDALNQMIKNDKVTVGKITKNEFKDWKNRCPDVLDDYANKMQSIGVRGKNIVERTKILISMSTPELEKLFDESWSKRTKRLLGQ